MNPLCTLKNLTLSYPHKLIFKEVTFTLVEGDKIGVLGLNGHGKSSLFKILAGLISADTTTPPFIFDKNRNFSLFYVPQELPIFKNIPLKDYFYQFHPEMLELKNKLEDVSHKITNSEGDFDKLISEQALIFEKLDKLGEEKVHNNYLSYLRLFGLEDHELTIENLSGGEQRKVALSLGLSAPQAIVLWDEPTNHLDLSTIELFEDELMIAKKTIMVISHDRSLLNNVVDRIVHIQHGKINSFNGTYAEYLEFLQQEQLRRNKEMEKLTNDQRRETAWISRGVKARRTKSKKRIEDYGILNDKIRELKEKSHKQVSLDLKFSNRKTKVLISGEGVSLGFPGKTLFQNLDFKICKGDKISLIGENGVGKSSLLKLFMGELEPSKGTIKKSENLDIGFFSQKREMLDPEKTPWELIGEGIDFVISNTGYKRHVASYLESFLFSPEEIRRPVKTFSGGEKNRLQLAMFMKHARDIWIFDEPTNDLDLETLGILEEELKNYEGALILVGHDRTFIENVTDKTWLINDQKLEVFEGGFSQAALFMEALSLEKEVKKMESLKSPGQGKTGLSYQEKKRYDVIQSEIEEKEKIVQDLKAQVEVAGNEEIKDLLKKLKKEERDLEKIIDEWMQLEEKLNQGS
ncbi:MAG: ABC-F family ATP-binding cassette domain-containing protein [Bacteriovoracales bacterium]